MKKRKKIIEDKKQRGEWAEMQFIARASEHGLPVSKPWGDSNSFDCVVGYPRKFAAVQVKCTLAKLQSGTGYSCSTCSSHKVYRAGAFDFLAAYVIPEDAWYIIPAKEIRGLKSISLCTDGNEAKYEKYREAWHLLREAAGSGPESKDPLLATPARSRAPGQEESVETVIEEPSGKAHATEGVGSAPRHPENVVERVRACMEFARRQMGLDKVRSEEREEDG